MTTKAEKGRTLNFAGQKLSTAQLLHEIAKEEAGGGLADVYALDVRNNCVQDWSFLREKLSHIKELNCNGNNLEVFPREICALKDLTLLSISYNTTMTDLPQQLGRLTKLEYLAFYKNPISRIPESFKVRLVLYSSLRVGFFCYFILFYLFI
jgi:Leucine-rich repeat (LRR) protein